MERTKSKFGVTKAILTSDWHLRDSQPVCRIDDFEQSQWNKVRFISELQKKYECPVLHAGDLFHHWKPSPYLLSKTIQNLPKKFCTIFGNHDLPQHNLELSEKSGVWTLQEAGALTILDNTHWGNKLEEASLVFPHTEKTIAVWHVMTWKGSPPYPGCTDSDAYRLLKKYPNYDLILTGHNHIPFTANMDGRILVNPGGITRQEADEIENTPRVYLYDGSNVKPVYLPLPDGEVITREHLDNKRERDERLTAFIEKLDNDWVGTLNFEDNLELFFEKNMIRSSVKNIIYESLDPLK